MNIRKLMVLMLAACCISLPSYAQRGGKAGGKGKGKKPAVHHTVKRRVKRQTKQSAPQHTQTQTVLEQKSGYHPVLGYLSESHSDMAPWQISIMDAPRHFQYEKVALMYNIQTFPLLTIPRQIDWIRDDRFAPINELKTMQVTEAIYLWRLANPGRSLNDFPHTRALLYRGLLTYSMSLRNIKDFVGYPPEREICIDAQRNWPSVKLLKHLVDPKFTPQSYAELAATTSVYPKHVTLNAETMPIPSAEAEQAEILDAMLMLSNPKEMGENTWRTYEPFILTPEEHAAADKLLSLRQQAYRLPDNPTPHQVLENLYNRLSSLPGGYVDSVNGYETKYVNSDIYPIVQQMVKDQHPVIVEKEGVPTLANPEITHLIVLDAIMNKKVLCREPYYAVTVLKSFEALCAYTNHNPDYIPLFRKILYRLEDLFWGLSSSYANTYGDSPDMHHIDSFWDDVAYGNADDIIRNIHF